MKKIFLIAVVLLMMINFIINYQHEVTKEKHTPMADFKTKVEMAPMKEYNDPDFGYVVKYPCFFQQEDTRPYRIGEKPVREGGAGRGVVYGITYEPL